MAPRKSLHLYEEILLLALEDRRGTIVCGAWSSQAVAGALLAELLLEGRLVIDGKALIAGPCRASTGDELLDEIAERVAGSRRRRSPTSWLSCFSGLRQLRARAAESLCRRGILRADRAKVLLFFERRVYPELDHAPERDLVERLERTLRGHGSVDPRTTVLVALAYHTGILRAVLGRKELKACKARIEAVIEGDAIGRAARSVIEGIQAAIIASAAVAASV